MKLFPIFADLKDRLVLVVGGGAVAERKTLALLEASAEVVVGAPDSPRPWPPWPPRAASAIGPAASIPPG